MSPWIRSLVDWAGRVGADPEDSTETLLQKRLTVALGVGTLPFTIAWSVVYLAVGAPLAAASPGFYSLFTPLNTAVFAWTRNLGLYRLALDMRDAVAERPFGGRRLAFRIGINSGPVVAGVIGRKKFIYDLWGESVNMASRMESHGLSGAVQITERTWRLVKDRFQCEEGGTIDVKGAGPTRVWHVVGDATSRGDRQIS
jgi:class 3 adenylate cyclase